MMETEQEQPKDAFDEAVAIIKEQLGRNNCVCPHGIGHPSFSDHTDDCKRAQNFVVKYGVGETA